MGFLSALNVTSFTHIENILLRIWEILAKNRVKGFTKILDWWRNVIKINRTSPCWQTIAGISRETKIQKNQCHGSQDKDIDKDEDQDQDEDEDQHQHQDEDEDALLDVR